MGIGNVVSSPDGHTQVRTYTGITTDDVQATFEADRAQAKRQGWVAVSQRWDASQPIPTLVIEYRHWSGPRRRAKSRWPAIGAVAVIAVVLLVMASANDRGENADTSVPSADPGGRSQPGAVVVPNRASTPRPVNTLRPVATPRRATPKPTPGKYEQTWHRSYGDTTCGQWASRMNAHQRFVAAADMLTSAQGRTTSLPPDSQVRTFRRAISAACRGKVSTGQPLVEIAAAIYLMSRDLKP